MQNPGTFLSAYNTYRYYGQLEETDGPPLAYSSPTGHGGASWPQGWQLMPVQPGQPAAGAMVVYQEGGPSPRFENGNASPSGSAMPSSLLKQYRSDMEDDGFQRTGVPNMSRQIPGMRRRTSPRSHVPMEEDEFIGKFAWVESSWFQGLSGFVIFLNAVIIGFETDISTPIWWYVEQVLLSFFVVELLFRFLRHGWNFFRHEEDWIWNVFDFSIVMSGVFDQWLLSMLKRFTSLFDTRQQKLGVVLMLMRMGRLLRIVRLFRLVRIVRPLFELAQGVLEALQGMFWVLVFMVMTLYAAAIVCTRLIGHGDALSEDMLSEDSTQSIQVMFSDVQTSMFTLFGTVSSWSLLKFSPLFEDFPILRPFFVLFYIYSSWALLSVMTGVVSENMIAIREQMLQDDKQKEELRKAKVTEMLNSIFKKGDVNNDGTVSRGEFELMMKNPELVKQLKYNVHMRPQDLQDLYDWLDRGDDGVISIDAFMSGFKWVNEPLKAKTLVKLQDRLNRDLTAMANDVTATLDKRIREVQQLVVTPLRKIHAVTEQMQSLDVQFGDLRVDLQDIAGELPTLEEIHHVEQRLREQLASVSERLDALEFDIGLRS